MTETAERLATRMPLSHFPAQSTFFEWSSWPAQAVVPRCLLVGATPEPSDPHDALRWRHAFLFGGPACFTVSGAVGDAVLYFHPKVDAQLRGDACPFDTGSCRPAPKGCLQPFAALDDDGCLAQIQASSVPVAEWRAAMREWLDHCYQDPERYLETQGDRWSAGEPDRTQPPELGDQNGARGRKEKLRCADRRAWTWEVRTTQPVGFEHLSAAHVASHLVDGDLLDLVEERRLEMERDLREPMRLIALLPGLVCGPDAFYADSEQVMRLLMKGGAS